MPQQHNDQYYMQLALALAAKGEGCTSPNPLVGAVVVKDGQIVGQGYHQRAGTPHAEVHALKEAGDLARGATIYVTLEPCCHYGRTPPCTEAIKQAGISRVVASITDPNPLVAGKGLQLLENAGLAVTSGVLADEAAKLNEVFIKNVATGRPFVVLKAAVSLDGKIATVTGESQWITGPISREFTHRLRHRYDGILVGVNTVLADNPSLTTRLPGGEGKNPVRIILDSKARTPLESNIIRHPAGTGTIIATTAAAEPARIAALRDAGADVLVLPSTGTGVDINQLLKELSMRQITSILVEGGAKVHASFISSQAVDKVYWFIAPMLIGGEGAPGAIGGKGIEKLQQALRLQRTTTHHFGEDICIEGYVK